MKESQALLAFAALSQDTRLRVVRHLVRAGPKGVPAGALAEGLSISPSNLSFHLKELDRAGIIAARREARSIIYTVNYDGLRGLIRFLLEDCCAGLADINLSPPASGAPRSSARKERANA
ncbi:MAG: metalloregulator ArsR/SmtB family transcription factor [Rhizobiales bacterium]|nr:metalloregulator ArsR/SmtB family transcription factor [Hyphomicrobiales bacterium]